MTNNAAKEALKQAKITLERTASKYVREHSGRTVMGKTQFQSPIIQREFNAVVQLSALIERFTPESYAAAVNGNRFTLEAVRPGDRVGEPDLNFIMH